MALMAIKQWVMDRQYVEKKLLFLLPHKEYEMSWLRLMEESIRKKERFPATNSQKKSGKEHKVLQLIREMWPAYVIEVLVITLGISITIAMEKWRDDVKEQQLEKIYVQNLASNINADQTLLISVIQRTDKIIEKGSQLMFFLQNPKNSPDAADGISEDVRAILDRPKFQANDATFSDLKSSGNLHLIEDIELKNILFSYYTTTESIKEVQNAEQMATINISGPFFLKRFSLAEPENVTQNRNIKNNAGLLRSVEFKNNVSLRVENRRELLSLYKHALYLSKQLDKQLNVVSEQ
jgi:hypothetical protein